jgi:GNAT superfamily N-acetyltransferase
MKVALAASETELARCFPVMAQLRAHLSQEEFVRQVKRQEQDGYRLAYLEHEGEIRSLAGFRVTEMLAFGRLMYVDDLVTAENHRSRGYGARLFDWLIARAEADGCVQLQLDSGVHRFAAHRFYLMKRMEISSHHFSLKLDTAK